MIDRLGAALADRYRIERELGAGGMATVYLARDLKHDRDVALKVLREDLAESLGKERFLREIRLAAGLTHPHILPVFDSGDAEGFVYYAMPSVEGQSLRDRLMHDRQLPVDDAVRIVSEVAGALDYAHRHGVVHRDIKPENIMLHDGHALVADFGIGKAVLAAAGRSSATLTQVGVTIGTPAYMSPEQAAGEEVDGRSDLFSLGCVLYELLTGELPFTGATVQAVIASRFIHTPPPIADKRAGVPASVRHAVVQLLGKSPDERPATGALVIELLRSSPTDAPASAGVATQAATPPEKERSVAVLPFENMSASAEDEYFADGMTEEIINALAQLKGLRVAARTSCFAFKGKHEDLRVVGEKLGVTSVLEGSVRKAGARIRITAQLINAADGYHLWSEKYDRQLDDVFALQDELAGAIATKLQLTLVGPAPDSRLRVGPRNVESYELLLKGRVLLNRRGAWIADAMACFERAIALDPDLAEAHALLGDSFRLLAIYGIAPSTDVIPRARAALERALTLEPEQVDALSALSNIASVFDRDWAMCAALAKRVWARDPDHVKTLCEHAITVLLRDPDGVDVAAVLRDLERAARLDPLNSWAAAICSISHSGAGMLTDALREAQRAIELDPLAITGRWALVWALSAMGRDADALAAAEPVLEIAGRPARLLLEMAAIYRRQGKTDAAAAIHDEIRTRAAAGYVPWSEQGMAAASAGRLDEARPLVRRGIDARESYVAFWKDPAWGPFLADPEGRQMLKDAGV